MHGRWLPHEQAHVEHMTRYSNVGSPQTVKQGLERLLEQTHADEIVTTAQIYDHAARLRSFELAAGAFEEINTDRRGRTRSKPPTAPRGDADAERTLSCGG